MNNATSCFTHCSGSNIRGHETINYTKPLTAELGLPEIENSMTARMKGSIAIIQNKILQNKYNKWEDY